MGTRSADAIPTPHGDGTKPANVHADGSPVTTTIASPPVSGWTYRTVSFYDFFPFSPQSQRTWGGVGMYTASSAGAMRATVQIPAGALIRDVEYYLYNGGTTTAFASAYLWVPGNGYINSIGTDVSTPPSGSQVVAARAVTTASTWAPTPWAPS